MTGEYHCTCDPHGDNARCDRECCQPRHTATAFAPGGIAQARRLYLHALQGGTITADDMSRLIALMERS